MDKNNFIKFMMDSGVLTFGDFITKSGRRSPYFINTGNYDTGRQISVLGSYYAQCIVDNIEAGRIPEDINVLFGPAYKGIPLVVSTAMSLANNYNKDIHYCFNRKEVKDHGEGGSLVGYKLKDGDRVLIIEDVLTAGTAVRQSLPLLKAKADVKILGLVISVDRMERGKGKLSAVEELEQELNIVTYPIVNVLDILKVLGDKEVGADIYENMRAYLDLYCAL